MPFSQKLKQILDAEYKSMKDAAADLDVNYSQLSHYVTGRKNPSVEFLFKIFNKFSEVDLNWLLKDQVQVTDVLSEDREQYKTPVTSGDIIAKIEALLSELKTQVSQK